MAEKLSLRTNANGDIYVYVEDGTGASLAFGADSANGVVALNTSATPNVEPLESTANMTIDPTANGDILFRPHGTGKSEFNTGNVQITQKSLYLPHTSNDGADGCIFTNDPNLGYQRTISFPDDWNIYIGKGVGGVGVFPNPVGLSYNIAIGSEGTFSSVSQQTIHNIMIGQGVMGNYVGDDLSSPGGNIGIGRFALENLINGENNLALGHVSGRDLTGSDSSNVCIAADGVPGDNGVIRIGRDGEQLTAFLAGVHGVTPSAGSQQLMIMDTNGQMGTSAGGSFSTNSFATDSGTATPAAGVITIAGGLNITTSGAASTVTVNVGEIVGVTNSGASTVPYIATGTGQLGTVPGGSVTMNTGTQSLSISSDASATTVNIATGAAVKTTNLGSTNSTSTTTVQSGSGALNITSTNGAMTLNSGTGTIGLSTDASATTVNLATGAAAKTVTLGSTNTTSSLALKYGTADFSLASATGNVMVAQDTGEITYPLQSSFLAYRSADVANVTGDGTVYTCTFNTEVFDRNSDYNNGTYTFTAPVTGLYRFDLNIGAGTLGAAHTIGLIQLVTTGRTFNSNYSSWGVARASNNIYMYETSVLTTMTAGDTATTNFQVYNSTKTVTFYGGAVNSWWSGNLVA